MIKKTVTLVFLIISFLSSQAGLKDSVRYYIKNKYPELIGGLSGRNTIIGSHYTSVSGVAIGADYGGKVKFLGGVYGLSSPLVERKIINAYTPSQNMVDEISRFWYFGFTGAYTFLKISVGLLKFLLELVLEQRILNSTILEKVSLLLPRIILL